MASVHAEIAAVVDSVHGQRYTWRESPGARVVTIPSSTSIRLYDLYTEVDAKDDSNWDDAFLLQNESRKDWDIER